MFGSGTIAIESIEPIMLKADPSALPTRVKFVELRPPVG
jgi:hypothetical protein